MVTGQYLIFSVRPDLFSDCPELRLMDEFDNIGLQEVVMSMK